MDNHGIKYFEYVDFADDKESEIDFAFMGSDGSNPLASVSNNFESALNEYKKSFIKKNKLPYVKLIISTSRKNNICENIGKTNIYELKRISSTCVSKRTIYLSPNCNEVYGERYNVYHKGSNIPRKFWFDYKCLYSEDSTDKYGPTILPKNGELVQTKFIQNEKMYGECYFPACMDTYFYFKLYQNDFVDDGKDVYYAYTTRTNIKCIKTGYQEYNFFDTFDNFVPAATMEQFVIKH